MLINVVSSTNNKNFLMEKYPHLIYELCYKFHHLFLEKDCMIFHSFLLHTSVNAVLFSLYTTKDILSTCETWKYDERSNMDSGVYYV